MALVEHLLSLEFLYLDDELRRGQGLFHESQKCTDRFLEHLTVEERRLQGLSDLAFDILPLFDEVIQLFEADY